MLQTPNAYLQGCLHPDSADIPVHKAKEQIDKRINQFMQDQKNTFFLHIFNQQFKFCMRSYDQEDPGCHWMGIIVES